MVKAETEKLEKGRQNGEMPETLFEQAKGLNFPNSGNKAEN